MDMISDLLHEYQYLFPNTLVEMKEILGELGVMKINLKSGIRLVC